MTGKFPTVQFQLSRQHWGLHTVDCFGLPSTFFSRYWNPGCAEEDFFVQSFKGENCLVVPPARAIHYLHHQAVATLIFPFWPSSYFGLSYPEIFRVHYRLQALYRYRCPGAWFILYLDRRDFMEIYWVLDWILGNPDNNLSIDYSGIPLEILVSFYFLNIFNGQHLVLR